MESILQGAATVLADNIDTDQIYPGRYLEIVEPREVARHCLEGVDPAIGANFERGGLVVAGRNFGCGSSREHAAIALLHMGASCVLADSFARIFFRNAINLGLPLLVCKGLSARVKTGERLRVDILTGAVDNLDTGERFQAEALGEQAMKILQAGGIKPLMRKRMGITE